MTTTVLQPGVIKTVLVNGQGPAGTGSGEGAGAVTSVSGRTGAVVLTKTDVGLANVDNTTDIAKPISTATQTALNLKANTADVTTALAAKADKADLSNVNNTSDANKPISTATQTALNLKADSAAMGTALAAKADSVAVATALALKANTADVTTALAAKADSASISNVDNTSDANKPISTATQTALNLKANQADISNVNNTSDANKPVSTAQAAAMAASTVVPFIADKTLALTDAGTTQYHPTTDATARTQTIPANASVPFPVGVVMTIDNDIGAGVVTIGITSDTLVMVGAAGSTGSRTLAPGGRAVIQKVASTRWRISGVGLT